VPSSCSGRRRAVRRRRPPWPLPPPSFTPLDSRHPTTSLPPLDPKQPSPSPCTPHRRQGRRHAGLQRVQRLRPAVGARRRRDQPGILLKSTRVNPLGTLGTSSGQVRPPSAVNSSRRCGQSAQGLYCSEFRPPVRAVSTE
jgi:hypothetical protein